MAFNVSADTIVKLLKDGAALTVDARDYSADELADFAEAAKGASRTLERTLRITHWAGLRKIDLIAINKKARYCIRFM